MREGYPYKPFITDDFERIREEVAERELSRIVTTLSFIGRTAAKDSVETFRDINTKKRYFEPQPVTLTDGLGLLWFTNEFLEDRAHRLVISNNGNVLYHREPFNIDVQKSPSPRVDLRGLEEVSGNNDAVFGLLCAPRPVYVSGR